ncbi:MAG: radical SAM protein [Desulfobacter sp.]
MSKPLINESVAYDVILIQPPLLQPIADDGDSGHIEKNFWAEMETYSGRLLGDLPTEASHGILSIGTYLKTHGYQVKIIDFHLIDLMLRREQNRQIEKQDVVEILLKSKSQFYGLSVLTIAEKWSNVITNIIRELSPGAYVFWGGYFPTKNDESILKKNRNVDFIVRNEGEVIVKDVLDRSSSCKEQSFSSVNGITYMENGRVFRNEDGMLIEDLDGLPFVDYSLYDRQLLDVLVPRVFSARGCSNRCLYCTADNSTHRIYRKKNYKRVVDEISHIKTQYGKNFFVMGDLEFLNDPRHAKDICNEIIARNLDVKWWCQVFPPNVTEELVILMKDAGNIQIALGIENQRPESLNAMNKKMDSNDILHAIDIIKKHDIQIQAYIMLGLPGETLNSSIETIKYIGELLDKQLIDVVHFSTLVPYPGSPLYMKDENIRILETDPNKYYMNCDLWGSGVPPYETKQMSQFEIYSIWLLSLAHAQKFFKKNKSYKKYYQPVYRALGIAEKKEAYHGTL